MAFCSSRFCSSRIPPRIRASESAILPFVCLRRENEGIQASPRIKFKSSGTLPLTLRAKRAVDLSTRFLLLRSVSFADSSSFFFFFFNPDLFFFSTPQVVHTVSTSEIEKQAVYCRCWKSGTVSFLFCFLKLTRRRSKEEALLLLSFLFSLSLFPSPPPSSSSSSSSPQQFPLCNGAHVAHNTETGDNVGPLIIKKD